MKSRSCRIEYAIQSKRGMRREKCQTNMKKYGAVSQLSGAVRQMFVATKYYCNTVIYYGSVA